MATVTAGITLTSAAGDLITDALSLSDTTTVTITDMVTSGLARAKLTSTAKGTASGQALCIQQTNLTQRPTLFICILKIQLQLEVTL